MILPAGPHKMYVAYFERMHLDDVEAREEIPNLIDVQPIIGWVMDEESPTQFMPQPITPREALQAGEQHRFIGEIPELIRRDAIELAELMWRRINQVDDSV